MFSFPQGTKMFQFPWLASANNMSRMAGLCPPGCPIRKPRGQGPFAPNPGLSQLTASFIASESQGIRRAPLTLAPPGRPRGLQAARKPHIPQLCHLSSGAERTAPSALCLIDLLVSLNKKYCRSMSQIASPNEGGDVENNGFEPLTPCLQSRCSSQLS